MSDRLIRYNLMVTKEERAKLAQIAKTQLVSAASVIRIFIHREHERLFDEAPHNHRPKVRSHQAQREPSNALTDGAPVRARSSHHRPPLVRKSAKRKTD